MKNSFYYSLALDFYQKLGQATQFLKIRTMREKSLAKQAIRWAILNVPPQISFEKIVFNNSINTFQEHLTFRIE